MSRVSRQAWLAGLALGILMASVDIAMALVGPRPRNREEAEQMLGALYGALCVNLIISAMLYYVSG